MQIIPIFKWGSKKNWYIVALLTAIYTAIVVTVGKIIDYFIHPYIKTHYPLIHYDIDGNENHYKYIFFQIILITIFTFFIILFFRLFGFSVIGRPHNK
jgi:putative Mn2+ efflux pump MntP